MTTDRLDPDRLDPDRLDPDWLDLTRRAALASHRLVGWIYWDPVAIGHYAALGPDPFTYYIASRGASLGAAGNEAVTAAFYSISPPFIALCLDQCRERTTFEAAAAARDAAGVRVQASSSRARRQASFSRIFASRPRSTGR